MGFCTFARRSRRVGGDHLVGRPRRSAWPRGSGTRLVEELAHGCTAEGRRLLIALTVSSSDGPDDIEDGYDATRAFYRSVGFVEARDFAGLLG